MYRLTLAANLMLLVHQTSDSRCVSNQAVDLHHQSNLNPIVMLKSQLRRAAQTPQNQKLPSSYPSGALIRIGALGGWESSISFLAFPYWMIWPCHHVCAQSPNWQLYFWGWALPDVKRECPSGTSNVSRHSDSFESRSVLVDDYWNSMGFASAEISASHSHCRSRFELQQVSSKSRSS